MAAQGIGAFAGVASAHLMFGEPLFSLSSHARSGPAQAFSEFVATFGLLSVIWGCVRSRPAATPFAVGAYITSAYWFTASTSFANPVVTIARAFTDTFAGIRPGDVPLFIVAQLAGALAATWLFQWLTQSLPPVAERVVVPHPPDAAKDVVGETPMRIAPSLATFTPTLPLRSRCRCQGYWRSRMRLRLRGGGATPKRAGCCG